MTCLIVVTSSSLPLAGSRAATAHEKSANSQMRGGPSWMKPLAAAALFSLLMVSRLAPAQDLQAEKRGEELVTKNCARCHAVGRTGASPHPQAPPFRTLSRRYKIEALEEALGEGMISGHPDMPEFAFNADDIGAIIAYLKSIQDH